LVVGKVEIETIPLTQVLEAQVVLAVVVVVLKVFTQITIILVRELLDKVLRVALEQTFTVVAEEELAQLALMEL
jgi:hypothetical protein